MQSVDARLASSPLDPKIPREADLLETLIAFIMPGAASQQAKSSPQAYTSVVEWRFIEGFSKAMATNIQYVMMINMSG